MATTESKGRTDVEPAPDAVMLIEGCKLGPIARAVAATLRGARFVWDGPAISGFHRLEHTRLKTGTTPG